MAERSYGGIGADISDSELVEAFRGGDESAFTVLMNRYVKMIRYVTLKFKVSGLEKEDLFQEGLMGFLEAARDYRSDGGAQFRNYAMICINRRLIALLKKSGTNRAKALNDYVSIFDESFSSVSGGVQPEDECISEEGLENIRAFFSKELSDFERSVLRCYLAGKSYSEIADILSVGRKSVDNSMQRVRKKLRDYISSISL